MAFLVGVWPFLVGLLAFVSCNPDINILRSAIADSHHRRRLFEETTLSRNVLCVLQVLLFKCFEFVFFVKCLVMPWKFPLIVNLDFKAYPSRHTLYFRRRVTDIRNIQVAEKEFSDVRPKTAPAKKTVRPRSPLKPTKCVKWFSVGRFDYNGA